ncbi:myomesin-2-like [Poecilia formosa]|uniref:myomesin-2-like n=2 Tax=Poecilia TaxID=8080 RepID=UPI0007B83FC6|nr:PREDICTED: myomesin-2-like [Poecilia formosa]
MSARLKRIYDHQYHHKESQYVVKEYSSSKASEERYEYKTQARIQEVVKTKLGEKYVREEPMIRGPQFLVRLRSHTVFENTPIKLFCTVEGYPMPVVKWYKDGVILDLSSGKYLVEARGGSHSLLIPRYSKFNKIAICMTV